MMIINAKIKILEEKRDEYLKLMESLVEETRKEDGVLYYSHFEDVQERNTFVVVENYIDEAAINSHMESPHFQNFNNKVKEYVAEEPVIEIAQQIK
ncbi:putative quinol monooxygenase [Staphylococcus pasteuri]|uniref:Signal transduction protein TRAP n=3 Tax=Staphylococcus TaxID=1279 RepID=A0ABY1H5L1_9STAP|nr:MULTISPECIES: putative quinol monooxygenase [Staphylococcus]RQX27456.1 antibiotic biosynthesis monooxygenase [Staphylococcus warneri]ATH61814.1 monooxygenase [Staphylococcus pasteuri]MBL3399115.1 antibiotic biosynthesis monooxygenase [Staphylococcus pasteuri]MBM6508004.1 antibiotic biosynthesis monooxygenase [Staphylococcus pasteuri]MCD9067374.1 antibiotic biosynthesis monooxygenase [Staphylococcus pasteuri]